MNNRASALPRTLLVCLGLALVTFALYSRSLGHDFLAYDDQQYVTENPHVQAGLSWQEIAWAFTTFYASNWHPVTWLSHMLDCQIYGLRPWGHHLTNVLFHTANTVLLFLALRKLTGAFWRCAAAAALFAWHPLHVESVAWVSERKDVLSAFFFFLTLLAYERYARAGSPDRETKGQPAATPGLRATYYFLALVCFGLGLMSKPMLVTVPFILLLLDYWPLRRIGTGAGRPMSWLRLGGEKIPFLLMSAGCCMLTMLAQRQAMTTTGLSLARRTGHALISYAYYLGVTFWPRRLGVQYPYPANEPAGWGVGALALLAALSWLAWRARRARPYALVGWLWYLGALVPVVGIVQVGDQAWADRYTYLPLIGLFVALAWTVGDWVTQPVQTHDPIGGSENRDTHAGRETSAPRVRWGRAAALAGLATAAGAALLVATWFQEGYWKSTRMLFEHAAVVTPGNPRALTVLGSVLAQEGKIAEAKALYLQVLGSRPGYPEAHYYLGQSLEREGDLEGAIAEYIKVLRFKPLEFQTHVLLGMALVKQRRYGEAAAHYEAALAQGDASATLENNLGRALHSQGRAEAAIAHYSAALRLKPDMAEAHNNLAVALLNCGRMGEAETELRLALRLRPADGEARYNLGQVLNQQEKWREAAKVLSELAGAKPDLANVRYQLGLAVSHLGKTREAMGHFAHALLVQPDFPEALDRLAWILATDPRPEERNGLEAARMAEHACRLTGNRDAACLMTLAAAYAEQARFKEAIAIAEKAKQTASGSDANAQAAKSARMIETFTSGRPWREGGP